MSSLQAYDLNRTNGSAGQQQNTSGGEELESMEYSSATGDSESYLAIHTLAGESSSVTGHYHTTTHADATDIVHEMHLALLYLLSNPDEFQRALATRPARGATTLAEWNAEYDNESLMTEQSESVVNVTSTQNLTMSSPAAASSATVGGATPLPFVVFADDAEVVLPQAHTASQLFGVERLEGIELEAAAGIPAISQLFLRWLALMPGGDHLNIIEPPGLTVMRIAGGRYRVTAAHRVVWTWMNEFAPLTEYRQYGAANNIDSSGNNNEASTTPSRSNDESVNHLRVGDLVTMTVVDVFETDNQGKLLSYCPTFDNRAVTKTHQTTETLRRGGSQLVGLLSRAKNSKTAAALFRNATSVARTVKQKVDKAVRQTGVNHSSSSSPDGKSDGDDYGAATAMDELNLKESPTRGSAADGSAVHLPGTRLAPGFNPDDDLERHEC